MVNHLRKLTTERARQLRKDETSAEELLWSQLRGRDTGFPKFRRQHPVPPYILDFACRPKKIAVEVDGATHSTDAEIKYDTARTAFLQKLGWQVYRYTNDEIFRDMDVVLEDIHHRVNS